MRSSAWYADRPGQRTRSGGIPRWLGWTPADLTGIDAVIGLSGAGVGDHRWTPAYKKVIRDSRVDSTKTLSAAIASVRRIPRVFLSGSAIGFYGDTDERAVDEQAGPGNGFLAGVVQDWGAATKVAEQAGARVVHVRTGLVMARSGGAFGRLRVPLRLGVAGRLGSGRQHWSWVTLVDEVRALRFLLAQTVSPVR